MEWPKEWSNSSDAGSSKNDTEQPKASTVRSFPRTARRRMAAASVAAALLVGTVSVPYASADDDLKDKQRKVEKSIDHAHDELDHSSKRLVAATERLEAARSQLATARTELATARGRLAVAQERDAEMQAALTQAEAELAAAEADLVAGQQNMDDQADQVASTVSDIYMEGDP